MTQFSNFYFAWKYHKKSLFTGWFIWCVVCAVAGWPLYYHSGLPLWLSALIPFMIARSFTWRHSTGFLGVKHRFVSLRWTELLHRIGSEKGGSIGTNDVHVVVRKEEYLHSQFFESMEGFLEDIIDSNTSIDFVYRVLNCYWGGHLYVQALHAHLRVRYLRKEDPFPLFGFWKVTGHAKGLLWQWRVERFMYKYRIDRLDLWIDEV